MVMAFAFKKTMKYASFLSDQRIIPRQDAGIMDNGQVDVTLQE